MDKSTLKATIKAVSRAAFSLVASRLVPILYYFIVISTISGVVAAFLSVTYLKNPGKLAQETSIVIPAKSSTIGIAKLLGESRIVEYPELFAILAKILPYGKKLKAGEYSFPAAVSPMEAMKKIQSGQVVVRKITFPEGLLTFQMLDIINQNQVLTGKVPDGIGEGELLPQTYDYYYGDNRAEIVKRMQEAMRKTIDELWEKRQPATFLQTKQQALVLASIIEKETALAAERKRVAAVFINRLKLGMRLQTDPSVIYAVTNGKSLLGRPLSHKDLETDSSYNTYKNTGLPPHPISNPGRASIEAALDPLATNELYFVANGSGGHIFSANLQEHNENVSKWRKLEAEAQAKQAD